MQPFICITSVHQDYIPVDAAGNFPVVVNTYSSVSCVHKVEYTLFEQEKLIKKGKLTPCTDWTWSEMVSGKGA
ncbi:MAG: hypothetical protein LIP01_13035 [Tannerellaceae bacterium]|nr:hypothetical protein [Tannerellaceae bacterium]